MLNIYTGENVKDWEADICFPECKKHPNEIIKLGEELVEKGLKKDISILTFSPLLIDAIDTYCEMHNTSFNVFLATDNETHCIDNDDLYIVYTNLGSAYKTLNMIKIRNNLGL